jgi:prepilin-type N-terminal cleavage/methylation domain-containing protein
MNTLSKRKLQGLRKQLGFTLVELMVASVLGLTVVGGMYTLLSVNKNSIRILSNVSLAQEKANFALSVMAEDLQMAGWPGVYDPNGTDPYGDRGNSTYAQFNSTGRFDTLVVSRRGRVAIPGDPNPLLAQNELDCVGDAIVPGQVLVHKYSVNPLTKELICESLPSGKKQTIIKDVEGFKVLYGVDTSRGPCPNIAPGASARDAAAECMRPTVYVNGSGLKAELDQAAITFVEQSQLRPVKTIRLGIAVSTEDTDIISRNQSTTQNHFHMLGFGYHHNINGSVFNEGRVIKYSIRTVALRQAMRGP